MPYCSSCGSEVNEQAIVCVKCGVGLPKSSTNTLRDVEITASFQIKTIAILIDTLIVYALTFVNGFLVGAFFHGESVNNPDFFNSLLGISACFMQILGFFIVGMRNKGKYWLHLFLVALCVWPTGLINVYNGQEFSIWFFGIIIIVICMGVGGGLRLLIPRKPTFQE